MIRSITIGLLLVLGLIFAESKAQPNIAGFWLGVTYPTNPNQTIYNYALQINQSNFTFSGTAQTSNPKVPFGGVAYIKGNIAGSAITFDEADKNGSTAVKNICFWHGAVTYNPVDESLIGTYKNIVNGTTCTDTSGGKVELYRVVLKSGSPICKGSPANLVVTGKNIRWYSSSSGTNLLATGNTYSPKITQTTTFYITQTLYQNESPPVPITVEVIEPAFKATSTNTGCDKANGSIEVVASGSTGWQYSLNGGAFQSTPIFSSLSPGSYTVVAKDAAGCQAAQSVSITTDTAPSISSLKSTPPHCETANGEVTVVATGGKAPLTYSIDYGVSFQSSPLFTKLAGGTYTLRARDANGCETNSAISLPAFKPMVILSTATVPTSCGQANGQANLTTSGGTSPVQYSINSTVFQTNTIFTGLKAGNYTLVARDNEGCTVTQSVSVASSSGPQLVDMSITGAACGQQNGAILITSTRAVGLDEYSLDGQLFQSSTTFTSLSGGAYTLTIRDDKNCVITQPVRVSLDCANLIHLPAAFSPNHDNYNDALTAYFTFPSLTILRFTVYDRWGTVMYNRANFALSTGEPLWDGLINGQSAPTGIYIYRMDCLFPDGTQTTYRESVALLN
ncbi:gliding motility-associated C-terminal domain-containing protein [Spirosoma sp. HMF4905]|uniref:Gliding motility-associated C-terminal domain-containing protein n=1 Tax=Spirosoma arboris TaxID=2682092 RepID=A0A7K1S4S8_9BACT|nr:gliding motility-associated C-terminal domain-containing protein [Spirosoma arboris]MVM28626.1 gliding motility-associated C-terminal domain-containing protein [Spirosoma arboris]